MCKNSSHPQNERKERKPFVVHMHFPRKKVAEARPPGSEGNQKKPPYQCSGTQYVRGKEQSAV
jgi:hypothetical protein